MRPRTRAGYTILELVLVIAVLIILGSVLLMTIPGNYGNTRQQVAADLVRQRLVEGRAKAMEQGKGYRLAVSTDKTRIRLAPDTPDFSSVQASGSSGPDSQVVEDKLDSATAELDPPASDTSGEWLTIASIAPDGTCKEDNANVVVKEKNFQPIWIQIRGVTGSARVVPGPNTGSN